MQYIQRAGLLLNQNRHQDAVKELKKALAQDPQNAQAYMLLAECSIRNDEVEEAIVFAKQAVGLDSDNPYHFNMLAKAYWVKEDYPMAEEAIDEAIRLYPNSGDFYLLKGHIAYSLRNWEKTLLLAEKSLELDSENVQSLNLRSMALVKLNRGTEAADGLDYALGKDPENAFSHANKGWAMLENNNHKEAFKHFREALRLDPNNEFARAGLLQAIKAENPVYRMILRYFLWMDKMSRKNQWVFIIGLYVIYQITIQLAQAYPEYGVVLYPLVIFYIVFAFSTWIATTVSNLAIQLHPLGKYALKPDEKLGANLTGGLLLGTIGSLATYLIVGGDFWMVLMGFFAIMLIPVGGTFAKPQKTRGRRILAAYSLGLAAVGLIGIFIPSLFDTMSSIFLIGVFIFSFASSSIH